MMTHIIYLCVCCWNIFRVQELPYKYIWFHQLYLTKYDMYAFQLFYSLQLYAQSKRYFLYAQLGVVDRDIEQNPHISVLSSFKCAVKRSWFVYAWSMLKIGFEKIYVSIAHITVTKSTMMLCVLSVCSASLRRSRLNHMPMKS